MYMCEFRRRDPLQNVMIEEFLKRGGEILAGFKGAICVRDVKSGVICLSAEDFGDGKRALEARGDYDLLLLSQPLMLGYVREKYSLVCNHPCFQAVYTKKTPPRMRGCLHIAAPDDDELAIITATYRFADPEGLKRAQREGKIFAAHAEGKFCGYIGEHDEGSMGMLEVFEPFRGRGYAAEMESFMINRKLAQGCTPYCHIIYDNAASYNLQLKLGLQFAAEHVFWTHKREDA